MRITSSVFLLLGGLLAAPEARASGIKPDYSVDALAAGLRVNAHAIIRDQDEVLTVKSVSRTVSTVRRVVTVLDEAGSEWGYILVPYDQLNTVSYLRGTLYNAAGKSVRQLKSSDIKDFSLSDGFSLANDNRGRVADLRQPIYPYTVEFEYEIVSSNPLFYSNWQPQEQEEVAVEQSTFTVITPDFLPLRYKEFHLPTGVSVAHTQEKALDVYAWSVRNLTALEEEPDGPPISEVAPCVRTAPSEFEVQGYHGKLDSWQNLGRWSYELNAGRDVLPEPVKAKIAALVQGEADERVRIRKVYEYLQANTRYISIQLGIGGWQTIPAATVSTNGYGDCKALTNYCMALLKAADVTAYCALVRADKPDIQTAFPSSQFNHVVLCVPLQKSARPDTVWLECTSQSTAFGYMGSFTGNRHALLLTPAGGKLVRTPQYGAADNRRERTTDVYIDPQGSATASVRTVRTGMEQDSYEQLMHNLNATDQKKRIADRLPLSSFSITKFSLTANRQAALPAIVEKLELSLPSYAPPSGKRVFLTPNLLSRLPAPRPMTGERHTDIWLENAFTHADTVRIHMPAGFKPESLPGPVQVKTDFGTYSTQLQALPDGSLLYVRRLQMPATRFSRTQYAAYQEFRRRISVGDKAQLVLVKTDI
ncbi:DUF3857 domain-containing protein [Hymenobacter sp. BT175]|uniref:DUF3857 domain-containing protein n=1 Tax=Hymenobacter translucens TaxID=2886507 RepID=UPI001D0EC14B|nr:DUF3857 domain-containing protein [Hymenobacter translucens]MCC2547959.1 DUF3857 domain-containing protein [Hymenobacter translucens]